MNPSIESIESSYSRFEPLLSQTELHPDVTFGAFLTNKTRAFKRSGWRLAQRFALG
jgi:hypothetical protein